MTEPHVSTLSTTPRLSSRALQTGDLRVLVAIASYGSTNDRFLARLIEEYRAMRFTVDVVIFSNVHKPLPPGVEIRVGLPARNPWSLPFAHKETFVSRLNDYDLFIYSEDDILITERNLSAFLEVTSVLHEDELAGFIRTERGPDGKMNYPEIHGHFHWDASSVMKRGGYALAFFTNEHAACYVLTRNQLRKAIASGGFLVKPHEWEYDLLCTAATDPYTQCGFRKLIPISHIDQFSVEHLSNRYVAKLGIGPEDLRTQLDVLLRLATEPAAGNSMFRTETKLRRRMYSKDLYEAAAPDVLSVIGTDRGSVLSIGCGAGVLEGHLASEGRRVLAIPVDPTMAASAAARGVRLVSCEPLAARRELEGEQFDWILGRNIFHLMPDPVGIISLFADLLSRNGCIMVSSPNMLFGRGLLWTLQSVIRQRGWWSYERTGAQFTTVRKAYRWCSLAGLRVDRVIRHFPPEATHGDPLALRLFSAFMTSDFVILAKRAGSA